MFQELGQLPESSQTLALFNHHIIAQTALGWKIIELSNGVHSICRPMVLQMEWATLLNSMTLMLAGADGSPFYLNHRHASSSNHRAVE
jgi:hypothetical protein